VFADGDHLQRIWKPIVPGDADLLRGGNVADHLSRAPVRDGFGELRLLALALVLRSASLGLILERPAHSLGQRGEHLCSAECCLAIHGGEDRGYPLDRRRITPAEERALFGFAADRLTTGMGVCHRCRG
jgi:hypothetical protein